MGGPTTAKRGDARGTPRQPLGLPHEALGILLFALSLLTLLSLLSFSPRDPALFSSGEPPESSAGVRSGNLIGTVGANLARGLFWLIGGGAYLLPLLLAVVGVRCFTEGAWSVTARSAGGSVVSVLFLSVFLHLEVTGVPTISSGLVFRGFAGGQAGNLIGEVLQVYFASTGAHIIVLAGLLISLLFVVPVSMSDLVRRVRLGWGLLREPLSRAIEWCLERRAPAEHARQRKVTSKPPKINRTESPQEPDIVSPPVTIEPAAGEPSSEPEFEPVVEAPTIVREPVSEDYALPDPDRLLAEPSDTQTRMSDEELKAQSEVLLRALQSFGIEGKVTEVHPGPVVTMYEFEPAPGIKVARIVSLDNDLALALKATSLRIEAPIPGKSVVGIEVPNRQRDIVLLKEVATSDAFMRSPSKLVFALGKDIFGRPVTADLKNMPHLLVAGATGAGKSVSLNSMLLSLLFAARPDEVKLLLIDPKMLEFQLYDGIPHLLRPVITDPKSAARGLGWVIQEMERRYKLLAEAGVRNIEAYNRWVAKEQGITHEMIWSEEPEQPELPMGFLSQEDRLSAGETVSSLDRPLTQSGLEGKTPPEPLPYIVVMIDELADLMMVAPKEVEDKIARLAQMARASGIHLVLATQRPSVDVLTGLIKANFPARIAFQVSSKTDSRTILDANGAEALLGCGDMLYLASGTGRLTRIHGSYVSDEDVRQVVEFIRAQSGPSEAEDMRQLQRQEEAAEEQERDEVYEQAKDLVLTSGQASASLIQRRLRVGYPRAARMIERMEQEGLVGAPGRDGRREVLGRRGPVGTLEEESTR